MTVSTYNDLSAGIVRDPSPGVAPKNSVYDAVDVLFDIPGMIRKRGRTYTQTTSSVTTNLRMIGLLSGRIYALKGDGTIGTIGPLDAFTSLGALSSGPSVYGPPIYHQGLLLFPTNVSIAAVGGTDYTRTTTSYAPANGTTITVTAGNPQVTISAGTLLTNAEVGDFITIFDTASVGARNIYIGNVDLLQSNTTIRVRPTPTTSFTATQSASAGLFINSALTAFSSEANTNYSKRYTATTIASHQNRVILGNVTRTDNVTSQAEQFPQTVFYTNLPRDDKPSDNANAQGQTWLFGDSIEANNRFDIGGSEPVEALAPIDDNELLIFTAKTVWRLTGYLETRTQNDAGGVTYDVHLLPNAPGCMDKLSVQQSRHGLIYANSDGIYSYQAGRFVNLLEGANETFFQSLFPPSTEAQIFGSYMLDNDTYVVSLGIPGFGSPTVSLNTLVLHIPSRALSQFTGGSTALFYGIQDTPFGAATGIANSTIGLRWWDVTNTAASVKGGQIIRFGYVNAPPNQQTGTIDVDDYSPVYTVVTQWLFEDAPQQLKRFWRTVWRHKGTPTFKVQTLEDWMSGGTTPVTIGTSATNTRASFTGPTRVSEAVRYTITGAATDTAGFQVYGFDHYYDALPNHA